MRAIGLEAKSQSRGPGPLLGRRRRARTTPSRSRGNAERWGRDRQAARRPLLKIKLGGEGDAERIAAVRKAPRIRADRRRNEAWTSDNLERNLHACADSA